VGSPFGDCLDVLVDTADSNTLHKYPLVFLARDQDLSGEKAATLLRYLQAGGTLIASISHLPDEIRVPAGIPDSASTHYALFRTPYDYDVTESVETGEKFPGLRYDYAGVEINNARVLGTNHGQHPLIWEVPSGKGRIVLTGVTYSQDCVCSGLLPLFKHIFARCIRKHLLALAEPPTLELIVNRGEGFLLVGAFNNYAEPWTGDITPKLDERPSGAVEVRDIWNEVSLSSRNATATLSFEDSIPPFELKVYRVGFGHRL